MDNTYCSVPQCKSRGNDIPRTSFHHFPFSIPLRNQWILKLKMGKEITNTMVVCGKHFQRSDYFPGERRKKKLKRNSVPSQNLPVGWGSNKNEETFIKKVKIVKRQERKKKSENFPPDNSGSQELGSNEERQNKKKLNHKPKEIPDNKSKPMLVITVSKDDPNMKPEVQNLLSAQINSELVNVHETKQNTFNVTNSEIIPMSEESDPETSSESEREMSEISENESSLGDSSCSVNKSSVNLSREEILQEKLKAMTERYKKARKNMQMYRHQWKLCIKQVDCLKTVIHNLKEINSIREDS